MGATLPWAGKAPQASFTSIRPQTNLVRERIAKPRLVSTCRKKKAGSQRSLLFSRFSLPNMLRAILHTCSPGSPAEISQKDAGKKQADAARLLNMRRASSNNHGKSRASRAPCGPHGSFHELLHVLLSPRHSLFRGALRDREVHLPVPSHHREEL